MSRESLYVLVIIMSKVRVTVHKLQRFTTKIKLTGSLNFADCQVNYV